MIKPELFDIVELLVNLPEYQQMIGSQGAIVECHDDHNFEVEFANEEGETTTLCNLSDKKFVIVWKSSTKQWLSTSDQITAIINHLSPNKQEEVLKYARLIYQKA
ncbi:MAG: DUF4926 domain-containing protein [Microcystaceae cyanobacterium]